jgi:hypothetical protein
LHVGEVRSRVTSVCVEFAVGPAHGSPTLEVLLDPGSQIGIYAINAVSEMTDIPITTLRY